MPRPPDPPVSPLPPVPPVPIVTLVGRADCHLCEAAAVLLDRLAGLLGCRVEQRAADAPDAGARDAAFLERVPVVLVGDRVVAEAPLDPARLRVALTRALRDASPPPQEPPL